MNEDEKLIPELKEWRKRSGPQFNMDTWIEIEGNIRLAIGYTSLFWPDFVEHNNCIFLKSHFSVDTFKHWENPSISEHYAQIESIMNHIHIADLFAVAVPRRSFFDKLFNRYPKQLPGRNDITKEQVVFFGNKLLDMYRAKLSIDFPNRKFAVSFDCVDDPENLEDYQLTFWQPENDDRKVTSES